MPLNYSKTAKPRRFWVGFVLGLGVAVIANLVPYGLTYRAYGGDGYECIGFPLTFRSQGGEAYRYMFSETALARDIAIGLGIALVIAIVWHQWNRIKACFAFLHRNR